LRDKICVGGFDELYERENMKLNIEIDCTPE